MTLRERGRRLGAGPVPDRCRPGHAARAPRTRRSCWTRRPASRRAERLAGLPLLRVRQGPVEPGPRRHRPGADPVRPARQAVLVDLPRFDAGRDRGRRGDPPRVPAIRVGGQLVTTVFDLLMAQYAVARARAARRVAVRLRRRGSPGTPAWQEAITTVPAAAAARVAREFARNAELSRGRSMIAMGAGHQPLVPLRPDLPDVLHADHAVRLPGGERRRLGALRRAGEGPPADGFQQMAFALDWQRPTRHMTGTSFFYLHSDQWRYESFGARRAGQPAGPRPVRGPGVRRLPGAGLPARLDAVPSGVRPQPARPGRRGRRGREAGQRLRRRGAQGRAPVVSPARTRTTRRTSRG